MTLSSVPNFYELSFRCGVGISRNFQVVSAKSAHLENSTVEEATLEAQENKCTEEVTVTAVKAAVDSAVVTQEPKQEEAVETENEAAVDGADGTAKDQGEDVKVVTVEPKSENTSQEDHEDNKEAIKPAVVEEEAKIEKAKDVGAEENIPAENSDAIAPTKEEVASLQENKIASEAGEKEENQVIKKNEETSGTKDSNEKNEDSSEETAAEEGKENANV